MVGMARVGMDGLMVGPTEDAQMRKGPKAEILRRLKCVEGHTRAVGRMLSEGSDSMAVLRQVKALQGALRKIAMLIAQEHLMALMDSFPGDHDISPRERDLAEITGILTASTGGVEGTD